MIWACVSIIGMGSETQIFFEKRQLVRRRLFPFATVVPFVKCNLIQRSALPIFWIGSVITFRRAIAIGVTETEQANKIPMMRHTHNDLHLVRHHMTPIAGTQ